MKSFLHSLVGKSLIYGLKSPDTDLYDLGFGICDNNLYLNRPKCTHALHIICRFKIISQKNDGDINIYHEDSSSDEFNSEIRKLIGSKVKRVELSEKNDLWIDFGDYWMVFATFENDEESWRYFALNKETPHLVASNSWLDFSN